MKKFALVLFDYDGYTTITEAKRITGRKERASRSQLSYEGNPFTVEILDLADDRDSLERSDDKWVETLRGQAVTAEQERRKRSKGRQKHGGYLEIWPTEQSSESLSQNTVSRVEAEQFFPFSIEGNGRSIQVLYQGSGEPDQVPSLPTRQPCFTEGLSSDEIDVINDQVNLQQQNLKSSSSQTDEVVVLQSEEEVKTALIRPSMKVKTTQTEPACRKDNESQTQAERSLPASRDNDCQTEKDRSLPASRDNDCQTEVDRSLPASRDNDCQTEKDRSLPATRDNDCQTETDRSLPASMDNDCQTETDRSLPASRDNDCQTETDRSLPASRDNDCQTEVDRSLPATRDNDCQTETDRSLPATRDNDCQTEKDRSLPATRDNDCQTEKDRSHPATRDNDCQTEKDRSRETIQSDPGAIITVPNNDGILCLLRPLNESKTTQTNYDFWSFPAEVPNNDFLIQQLVAGQLEMKQQLKTMMEYFEKVNSCNADNSLSQISVSTPFLQTLLTEDKENLNTEENSITEENCQDVPVPSEIPEDRGSISPRQLFPSSPDMQVRALPPLSPHDEERSNRPPLTQRDNNSDQLTLYCKADATHKYISDWKDVTPGNFEFFIPSDLSDRLFSKSCSAGNFLWMVTKRLYKDDEIRGRNFNGKKGKSAISPRRKHTLEHLYVKYFDRSRSNFNKAVCAINSGILRLK